MNAKDYKSYYRAASALDRDSGIDVFKALSNDILASRIYPLSEIGVDLLTGA